MKPGETQEGRITGAASVVGLATVASRLLGYIRDMVTAYFFGAGFFSDAFFVAFRISNLLRRLVGEGALTSSFIPIFTEEYNRRSKESSRAMVSSMFTLFAVILIIVSIIGIFLSGPLVSLLSPGFRSDPEKFTLTVSLTRIMFPYMVFVGLMAIAMGVLNSMRHFAAPALSPVFFNLSIIFCILVVAPMLVEPVYALAIGVLVGGALQFLVQLPYLKKYGFTPMPLFRFADPAIKKIFTLMGPAAFGVGIYQLNIFVTLWFASRLSEGSVSYLYYAGRLMELPLGVFGVAISTAVLPSLSEHVVKKNWDDFRSSLSFAMRLVVFVTVPAAVGLFVLSLPVIEVLFGHGEFGSNESSATALALYYYCVGLVPVAVYRVLVSVFYSLKDTVTPVIVAFVAFVFNILMCLLLVGPLGHGGLALATSLAAIFNMAVLVIVLKMKFGAFGGRAIASVAAKSSAASIVMGLVVYAIIVMSDYNALAAGGKGIVLGVSLAAGVIVYLVLSRVLRVSELRFIRELVSKRRG